MARDEFSGENLTIASVHGDSSQEVCRKRSQAEVEDIAAKAKSSSGSFFGEEEKSKKEEWVFPAFDVFPETLRLGPWSPLAKVFLVILVSFVLCTLPFLTRPELPSTKWNWTYAAVSAYMIFVQIQSVYKYKWFPLATYTCWSYFLLNLHFLFHAVDFPLAAELLRFPSLAMATVTTTVWWLVLFPVILGFCDSKSRSGFMKLNFSFFLMNMHLLNFPLALSSYWLLPRALVFTDFWVATIVAIVYLFFYLLVLDPNGVHLYIILSPRPWWCVLSYSGILALYAGLFQAFSHHPHLG
ncbi:unnamed protein product [Durusdinium trenchii]|uniref:Glycerophosphocholine acyltransferase 1 n=1 Tax=Durusdinium trenchii TaxID=1381693 RepID=A0ABP0LAN5_9DINO